MTGGLPLELALVAVMSGAWAPDLRLGAGVDAFQNLVLVHICVHVQVGTFTLFQETYHRETFKKMHVSGPKSDYDHRLLTQVCIIGWGGVG